MHFYFAYAIIIPELTKEFADVAQSVERRLGKAEVTGSIPVISFFIYIEAETTSRFGFRFSSLNKKREDKTALPKKEFIPLKIFMLCRAVKGQNSLTGRFI